MIAEQVWMIGYSHIREFQQQSDRHVWDTKKIVPGISRQVQSVLGSVLSPYMFQIFLIIDTEVSFLSG